ncbi:NMD3 family-domain-containing protein [Syncephalis pseudoplumigaleata]|uniref:60S ribosomal export protein NMD3 n=1 Tax=Syncephalis pseudoplumigaleata TaxID=1712513 RepID=A0A4P9YW72_9FUNG|nr:NMD3 family-domain-containing protein [Syncephalis pseudoplumigaleata]|eukprot:RKP23511.1 NMD3 family-domain-containing protein [Syncephalis pseudoplumigaleata]
MCVDCIRNEVDITEGIPKQVTIQFCRDCERYLQPPTHWIKAELESRELLTLCLKKLRGLNKVRLIDASFIWTEPHSKRVKVKLTVQKEVFAAAILQQIFEVEYIVSYQQCEDCTKVAAQNTWKATVQVRQKVPHKRTFLYLEQLILKHNAHRDTVNIKEAKDGLDFFYAQRGHAIKMCEFLGAVVPTRSKTSEQLISTDVHTSTSNYKFTYSVEIAPICKDDLICLPSKLARSLGNISQLVLCTRVGTSLQLIDANSLQGTDVTSQVYWRTPFTSLASAGDMCEYYVHDVELLGPTRGKYALADVQVARTSDFGRNDTVFFARSHLGNILNPGDHVLGYDLTRSNFNNTDFDRLNRNNMPDVILVKKTYPVRRKKNKSRSWKLRTLAKEEGEMLPRKQEQDKIEQDYELFLRDLEEDPEMRATVNLYKGNRLSLHARTHIRTCTHI